MKLIHWNFKCNLLKVSILQVSVRVHNRLKTEGVTFHWHGILQRGTPWMDGASMISQCPIMPGQVFEYRYTMLVVYIKIQGNIRTRFIFAPLTLVVMSKFKTAWRISMPQIMFQITQVCLGELKMGQKLFASVEGRTLKGRK